jgi:hypothetical protein
MELLSVVGERLDDISDLERSVGPHFAVLETDLEGQLEREIEDYGPLAESATREYGPVGKPLRNRFIAQVIAGRALESEDPSEVVPRTTD